MTRSASDWSDRGTLRRLLLGGALFLALCPAAARAEQCALRYRESFSRLPALGLLFMTAVIHFVVGYANDDYLAPYHYVWMLAFGYLVIRGGGPLSVDGFIMSRMRASTK